MQISLNQNQSDKHFQDLMIHRIHDILLVSSPYDAFILEEDGHLTEQILTEYIGMNFNYAPRVTRVRTGYQAMRIIKEKKFDLVILMLRIEDQDPISLNINICSMPNINQVCNCCTLSNSIYLIKS